MAQHTELPGECKRLFDSIRRENNTETRNAVVCMHCFRRFRVIVYQDCSFNLSQLQMEGNEGNKDN